jgi:hypothetical protein
MYSTESIMEDKDLEYGDWIGETAVETEDGKHQEDVEAMWGLYVILKSKRRQNRPHVAFAVTKLTKGHIKYIVKNLAPLLTESSVIVFAFRPSDNRSSRRNVCTYTTQHSKCKYTFISLAGFEPETPVFKVSTRKLY